MGTEELTTEQRNIAAEIVEEGLPAMKVLVRGARRGYGEAIGTPLEDAAFHYLKQMLLAHRAAKPLADAVGVKTGGT